MNVQYGTLDGERACCSTAIADLSPYEHIRRTRLFIHALDQATCRDVARVATDIALMSTCSRMKGTNRVLAQMFPRKHLKPASTPFASEPSSSSSSSSLVETPDLYFCGDTLMSSRPEILNFLDSWIDFSSSATISKGGGEKNGTASSLVQPAPSSIFYRPGVAPPLAVDPKLFDFVFTNVHDLLRGQIMQCIHGLLAATATPPLTATASLRQSPFHFFQPHAMTRAHIPFIKQHDMLAGVKTDGVRHVIFFYKGYIYVLDRLQRLRHLPAPDALVTELSKLNFVCNAEIEMKFDQATQHVYLAVWLFPLENTSPSPQPNNCTITTLAMLDIAFQRLQQIIQQSMCTHFIPLPSRHEAFKQTPIRLIFFTKPWKTLAALKRDLVGNLQRMSTNENDPYDYYHCIENPLRSGRIDGLIFMHRDTSTYSVSYSTNVLDVYRASKHASAMGHIPQWHLPQWNAVHQLRAEADLSYAFQATVIKWKRLSPSDLKIVALLKQRDYTHPPQNMCQVHFQLVAWDSFSRQDYFVGTGTCKDFSLAVILYTLVKQGKHPIVETVPCGGTWDIVEHRPDQPRPNALFGVLENLKKTGMLSTWDSLFDSILA